MNKRSLKGKKGFTLVECIVAMAVLVIMSLLLAMILSATVQQRNKNMELERAIDTQVEQIGNNAPVDPANPPVEDPFNYDLEFKDEAGNSVKIPGDGAVKKTFKDDNVQIGKLEYPEYGSSSGVSVTGETEVMLMTSHSTDNGDGTVTYKVSFHFTKGDTDKPITFTFNDADTIDSVSVTGAGESKKAGNAVIFSRKSASDSPQYMSATIKFSKKNA